MILLKSVALRGFWVRVSCSASFKVTIDYKEQMLEISYP